MKTIAFLIMALCLVGCGSPGQTRQDIQRQYAELDQINDVSLRHQKFLEIKQQQDVLENRNNGNVNVQYQPTAGALLYNYGMRSFCK